jgi:hypothetical protein
MRYYKYDDEYSPIDGGVTYIEVDNGRTWRQITVNGGLYLASNLAYPHWGMTLAEGQVDYDLIDEVTEISQTEFESVWDTYLVRHQARWSASKQAYPIGTAVQSYIQIFYPQGVIVNLGDDTLGVADYAICRASAQSKWLYPGHKVTAIVVGYDEVNHWLLLGKPQVHSERLQDYRVQ